MSMRIRASMIVNANDCMKADGIWSTPVIVVFLVTVSFVYLHFLFIVDYMHHYFVQHDLCTTKQTEMFCSDGSDSLLGN